MRPPRVLLLSIVVGAATFAPFAVFAQDSSVFSSIVPQSGVCTCPGSAPDWGCILQIVQNTITVGIGIAILVIVLAIAWAGFTFMTAGANPGRREQGRRLVTNAVIGLFVILAAWLFVDFLMKAVYDPETTFSSGTKLGPWNSIWAPGPEDMCLVVKEPIPITGGSIDIKFGAPVGYSPAGSGSCTVPTAANNPCSVQSLASTCFAASGEWAARVCMKESMGGQQAVLSGSDKLNSGKGPSYSVGLWQINLTTAPLKVGGRSCTEAFSERCQGAAIRNQGKLGWCRATIKDLPLYNACVAAAQKPDVNTRVACSLYNPKLSAWRCSASRCGVPGATPMSGPCAPGN